MILNDTRIFSNHKMDELINNLEYYALRIQEAQKKTPRLHSITEMFNISNDQVRRLGELNRKLVQENERLRKIIHNKNGF